MGVPGTNGFPAEFLLILSTLDTHTGAGLAALAGVVIGAAYFLGSYRRAFPGQANNSAVADVIDLRSRELGVIAVMAVLIVAAGCYPDSVLELTRVASEDWVRGLESRLPAAERLTNATLMLAGSLPPIPAFRAVYTPARSRPGQWGG